MTMLIAKSTKRKIDQFQKRPVRCLETGIVYASSGDASDILSFEGILIEPRNIISACQGRTNSAGGNHWEYADRALSEKAECFDQIG
jgi:hypothetical protein